MKHIFVVNDSVCEVRILHVSTPRLLFAKFPDLGCLSIAIINVGLQ